MTRRIALLVLTSYWSPVENLLATVDSRFDIFVHVDLKSHFAADELSLADHVHVLSERVEVYWGGWSMVLATLRLLRAAMSRASYERYVLVSGDSLPLLDSEALETCLLNRDTEYISAAPVSDDPLLAGAPVAESVRRYRSEHPWRFQNHVFWDNILLNPMGRGACMARYGIGGPMADVLRNDAQQAIEGIAGALPPRPALFKSLHVGAQWWALSAEAIELIREDLFATELERFFRFFAVPDEHVFSCLIGNRLDALRDRGRRIIGTMMWTNHRARAQGRWTLAAEELAVVRRQHGPQLLFARKFDPQAAPDVADAIRNGRYAQDILHLKT